MTLKALIGSVATAALVSFATDADAVSTFQLQIHSGSYDSGVILGTTGLSGTVEKAFVANGTVGLGAVPGDKFSSSNLKVQGAYNYDQNGTLYMSLDVPDITHQIGAQGTIDFYLTLTGITSPVGNMHIKYDLSGANASTHTAVGFDNSSQGWLYYSATNSATPETTPGSSIVTTPAIASNFAATPTCTLAAPGSLSYSCEYINPVTLNATYSLTEKLELSFAADTKNKTARGQVSFQVPFNVPEPATLALFGTGLLLAGASFRRRKAAPKV
jgi:hypothetical protein